jgi:hypothetical protein
VGVEKGLFSLGRWKGSQDLKCNETERGSTSSGENTTDLLESSTDTDKTTDLLLFL